MDEGESLYTLKMERSALGMVYGHSLDIPLPIRHSEDVKRSRHETANDKHISRNGKYKDVFTVVTATGCRRCDVKNLTVSSLIKKMGDTSLI